MPNIDSVVHRRDDDEELNNISVEAVAEERVAASEERAPAGRHSPPAAHVEVSADADASAGEALPSRNASAGAAAGRPSWPVRFLNRAAVLVLAAVAFLGVVLYAPFTGDPLLLKVTLFEMGAVLALALWFARSLAARKIRYPVGLLPTVFLALAAAIVLAVLFSVLPWSSLWGNDQTGEKALSLLAFMGASYFAMAFSRRGAEWLMNSLGAALGLLGLWTCVSILILMAGGSLPGWLNINPAGTLNALAYVLGAGFLMAFGAVLARALRGRATMTNNYDDDNGGGRRGKRSFLGSMLWIALAALLYLDLVLIGFRNLWIAVAIVTTFFAAISFMRFLAAGDSEFKDLQFKDSNSGEDDGVEFKRLNGGKVNGLNRRGAAAGLIAVFAVLGLSVIFTVKPAPFATESFQPPVEVSPAAGATWDIATSVLRERPFFGYGPSNFGAAYNRFHSVALNSTQFWAARFSHGYSFIATAPVTLGVVGTLVLLLFALVALWTAARRFWREEADPLAWGGGGASLLVLIMWFIYAGNFTATLLLFLGLGMAAIGRGGRNGYENTSTGLEASRSEIASGSALAMADSGGGPAFAEGYGGQGWKKWFSPSVSLNEFSMSSSSFVKTSEGASAGEVLPSRNASAGAAGSFILSLAAVSAGVACLLVLYGLGTVYAGERYFNRAALALNKDGNVDTAKVFLEKAMRVNPGQDGYPRGRAQVGLIAVQQLINQAAAQSSSRSSGTTAGTAKPNEDISRKLQEEFRTGVGAARSAVDANPREALNWSVLGQLYETMIAFVTNADGQALEAYRNAAVAEPANPVYPFAVARTYVTVGDILGMQISQTSNGDQRSKLEAARKQIFDQSRQALQAAVDLKVDYAQAHFLAAQIAVRENNLAEAVRKTEDTLRVSNAADVGVLFQLGFLYFQAQDWDRAKMALEAALLQNENYSNARYFLGLVWEKKGDRDAALSQFQKIGKLNPDNEEVKRIIANLEAGKSALSGIVPPAPAPEKRKEAPVKEGAGAADKLRKR